MVRGINTMRSSTIVMTIGLLASPLAWLATPDNTAAAAGFTLVAAPATETSVNGHVLTDAPMPRVGPEGIAPVDRAAGAGSRALESGPTNSTPFSSTPSGTLSSGGSQTSNSDRVNTPTGGGDTTPNLGK